MKVPDSLKIGGHRVKVEKDYVFREIDDCLGMSLVLENRMLLGSCQQGIPMSETSKCVNLLHETIHWVDHVYLGKRLEESEVKVLAEGLFQVLRDNDLDFRGKR